LLFGLIAKGNSQAVEHFGFWRAKHHPGSQNVQPSEVAEFLHSRESNRPFAEGGVVAVF
jgi:hypothetical protein